MAKFGDGPLNAAYQAEMFGIYMIKIVLTIYAVSKKSVVHWRTNESKNKRIFPAYGPIW